MNKKEHTILVEKYRPSTLDTYICTDETRTKIQEYLNNQDLHSRRIITNHVVFLLSDSNAGSTYSQSITRVHDDRFRESNLRSWIDQEHGLDVKSSAVFVNHSSQKILR